MNQLKEITKVELTEILENHKLWLESNYEEGKKADLSFTNLEEANLEGANLYNANLEGADLTRANLKGANLEEANLEGANLYNANLYNANLYNANLTRANLEEANLYNANLTRANLEGANLTRANLKGADLKFTNLDFASWPLWCGSLRAKVDSRLINQFSYHLASLIANKEEIMEEEKEIYNQLLALANKFHRVTGEVSKECPVLEVIKGATNLTSTKEYVTPYSDSLTEHSN